MQLRVPLRPRELCAIALVCVCALAASGTHVVRSGETLGTIAIRNGTTVRALVEANKLADPDRILVGQQLTIPGTGGATGGAGAAGTTNYTVQRGDTLAEIAARFRTTVKALAEANGIHDPNLIRVGSRLAVQGSAASGGASAGSGTSSSTGGSGSAGLPGQRHTVHLGDTIAGIANRYGLSSADLIRWNGLIDGKIYATTRLLLYNPGSLPNLQTTSSGGTHTVHTGETLSSIAAHYGVRPSAIVSASGISNPNRIYVGQELTIPGGSSGSAQCPVPGGTYFNDWAFPRSGGRSHAGTDIFAPRGTPVHAPVDGFVDLATGSIGGHQFRLTAADGSRWYGSHLDSFGKSGTVHAGDVIGYVGDTGNARGGRTHLHFEVHNGATGNAVNPYPLLRAVC